MQAQKLPKKKLSRPEGAYVLPEIDKLLNESKTKAGALSTSHPPEVVLYVHRNYDGLEWR
ncbi:MAG: hypothetical protein K2X81_02085 [Candidatus Obscuribacterales bacterium]|nr:hypothetical protein [Candidatus Obscuribacterales bacterium]